MNPESYASGEVPALIQKRTNPRLEASHRTLERALADADVLNASQRANARLMAHDLRMERVVWESVPFRLQLEMNRRCNVKCTHCDIGRSNTGELDLAIVERLLDAVGWGSMEIMPFVGGEPTLAPLVPLAKLARRHRNWFNLTTNGLLFTRAYYESIADVTARVHFSLHSHRRATHERIMPGAPFDTVLQNVTDAVRIAETTGAQILTGMTVMDSNLDELVDYVHFVADLGIRRIIFQKLYPWTKVYERERLDRRYGASQRADLFARVVDAAVQRGIFLETNVDEIFVDHRNDVDLHPRGRFDILNESAEIVNLFRPGFCISTAISVLVEWDGTLIPCCRDHIVLGNLHEHDFLDLWNGEPMRRLRASFFENSLRPFCAGCMAFYCGHA
ncbi:MAG: radical SAM protein [Planctomycetes bacterium]|nr:radical SAM protein [Planctomycetota bacterium]